MLQTAALLLVLTAVGGIAMALQRMTKRTNPPNWLAMAHGLLAAAALTLLIYAAVTDDVPATAVAGTIFLLVAAAGGVVMNLSYHLNDKLLPQWLLHLHIALAMLGTAGVLWGAWGSST